jgi:uncharacterized protein (DUF58 family)
MSLLKLGKDNWARTRPTKEGLTFIALSLFVGFAAINTGNNLLYLTFGIMMSFVAASGFLSMINLSGIEVKILPQGDVFALTPATLKFSLINGKAVIPSTPSIWKSMKKHLSSHICRQKSIPGRR